MSRKILVLFTAVALVFLVSISIYASTENTEITTSVEDETNTNADLQAKAEIAGVDITGLSQTEAIARIDAANDAWLKAKAEDEPRVQIEAEIEAMAADEAMGMALLKKKAEIAGADITGLSEAEAIAKIDAVTAARIKAKEEYMKSEEYLKSIDNLKTKTEFVDLQTKAKIAGVDITGLSEAEAIARINAAEDAKIKAKNANGEP